MHRPTRTATAPSTGITLSVTAFKQQGQRYADLTWTGATAVAVFRDNVQVATDDASPYRDGPLGRGVGTATYGVCSTASPSTCSNSVTVTW